MRSAGSGWATAVALLAVASTLGAGPAPRAEAAAALSTAWTPDLAAGEGAGITVSSGTARLDPARAFVAPADGAGAAPPLPTGLLTLPPHRLATAADRIGVTLRGEMPAGSTATVDVRGLRPTGGWTEWVPAAPGPGGLTAALPEPASQVQGRLVLSAPPGAAPVVRGVTLTANAVTAERLADRAEQAPLTYRVFATREGLVGGTTANGHVIAESDHFVALPSRRALAPRDSSDYSVKVCAPGGRCAFAPVWDVGPWNTRDDYWNPPEERQEWRDLPQGVPQAQAARESGYNGGKDQYGRRVANPAGIDLGDGLFRDALGLEDNSWVSVDYLWTGSVRLSQVSGTGPVLAAPDAAAPVVGAAADRAAVPVQCAVGSGADRWLRIGDGQYLPAARVPRPGPVGACRPEPAPVPPPPVAQPPGSREGAQARGAG